MSDIHNYLSWHDVKAVVMMNEKDFIHGPLCTQIKKEENGVTKITTKINYLAIGRGEKTTTIPNIVKFSRRVLDDCQFYLHVHDGQMRHYVEIDFDLPAKAFMSKVLRQKKLLVERNKKLNMGERVNVVVAGNYKAQPIYIAFDEDGKCGKIRIFGNKIAALMLKRELKRFLEKRESEVK